MTNIRTFIFDLDGTLLTMDTKKFMKIYFDEMGKHFYNIIEPKQLIADVLEATKETVLSKDFKTNEEVFFESFKSRVGDKYDILEKGFRDYYESGYIKTKEATKLNQNMVDAVACLKDKGYEIAVATNPLFPRKAIHDRIRWAGFKPEDFKYITSFEENHYCKPQIKFYEEVIENLFTNPENCIMVGNDVQEDLIIRKLGVTTWLVEDCVINRTGEEAVTNFKGSSEEFLDFVSNL